MYVFGKGKIDLWVVGNNDMTQKGVVFETVSCISKINNTFIDNAVDLDIVMQCIMCSSIVTIILWHQKVWGNIIKIMWIMLMIKLQMVNQLSIRQK